MRVATINAHTWAQLVDAASRALPRETGGLLLGYYIASEPHIVQCVEVPDPVATSARYRRDAATAAAALRQAVASETDNATGYIGEWHSHPGPNGPSETDSLALRQLAVAGAHDVLLVVIARASTDWIGHVREATPDGNLQRLMLQVAPNREDHLHEPAD
ncbi:Mov34/MPN/PAD-1 family protein [Micrococcus luteus]|uniref:Mov34/MPN/PAD-1 family protein n=1 Tax=Micrococcus luteus TaxID=1270 RepID=UPI001C2171FE|nr:Mov34/MPN/PAD-1 family protein [Micrococcus luteus]